MKTRAQELGEAIEKERARTGASQEDLAKAVGVTQQAFSGWEAGASLPRPARLKKLLEIFGSQSEVGMAIEHILPAGVEIHRAFGPKNLRVVREFDHKVIGGYTQRPHDAKSMGTMTSEQREAPPMSTEDKPLRAEQPTRAYGITSFENQSSGLPAGEIQEALTRAANGVRFARQVLDDAEAQIERALFQLQNT